MAMCRNDLLERCGYKTYALVVSPQAHDKARERIIKRGGCAIHTHEWKYPYMVIYYSVK